MAEELLSPMPPAEPTADLESRLGDTVEWEIVGERVADTSSIPHAGHEDVVESQQSATDNLSVPAGQTGDDKTTVVGTPEKKTGRTAGTTTNSKTTMVVKPPGAKNGPTSPLVVKPAAGARNGPTSPLVKRIINSGTFGAGAVKSTTPKGSGQSPAASKTIATAPSLKKSISAPPPKPDIALPKPPPSATDVSSSGMFPTRRASLAPAKPSAPPISRPSLSSSTSAKLATTHAARPTVVSPTGSNTSVKSSSAARPRAAVSEGVKRATSRQSLSATTKPPVAKSSAPMKMTRGPPSISSITEVKEDAKALEDLQIKLKGAEESLASKTDAVAALEEQVNTLKTSLDAIRTDAEATQLMVQQLEETSSVSEKELKDAKEALEVMRTERQEGDDILQSVRQTLEDTKTRAVTQTDLIQNLQAQIQSLETEVLAAKESFETLNATKDSEAAAAAVEHEALIKAKADLEAIRLEARALELAHAQALGEATEKLRIFESEAARSEALGTELAELRKEREENANKLSELEVEILELKESQEAEEDQRGKSLMRLKELEAELSKATTVHQQAIEDTKVKEEEYIRRVEDARKAHGEELKTASEAQAQLVAQLELLKTELAGVQASAERAKAAAQAAQEDHTLRIDEAEKTHLRVQNELSEQLRIITVEFEGQEALYNAKVDAVKAEHDRLLREEFERAKNEAGAEHSQDLQRLRAESQVTTEELRTAHQMTVENLKAEHAATLESEIKVLEKQINNQSIELKATQDDLAKAKTALDFARGEVETLTAQRDEARAAAAASPVVSPEQTEQIERRSIELEDDLAATKEMLVLTKATLSDVSQNHQRELEEAAMGRAEEVNALRNAHDTEVTALATHKSELLMRISDLEGELATIKASVAVEPPVAPKSNGAAHLLGGVTKEELQRMHEAHNSKILDLQADHNRVVLGLKEELERSLSSAEASQQGLARKAMEIQYLEQEQDESQDQITRLKEDLENLTEQLEQYKAQNTLVAV